MPRRRSATGRGRGRSDQERERTGTRRAAGRTRTTTERTAPARRGRGVARRGCRPSTASRDNNEVQSPTAAFAEPLASSATSSSTSHAHSGQTSSRVQASGGASENGEFLAWPIVSDNAQLVGGGPMATATNTFGPPLSAPTDNAQLVGGGPMATATNTFGPPPSTQPSVVTHDSRTIIRCYSWGRRGSGCVWHTDACPTACDPGPER